MEYITIASIMVCMTVWDFVIGVLFGIIVSCQLVYRLDRISFCAQQTISIRFVFRHPKFSASKHSCIPYWRNDYVDSTTAELTEGIYS
jgi:hypothetical protein